MLKTFIVSYCITTTNVDITICCCSVDPIEVGYDPTIYRTNEGQGSVMLTIRIFEPMSGGAPRPFNLSVSTQDDTASTGVCINVYYRA